MADSDQAQLQHVTFRCKPCDHTFKADPARIEDAPGEFHPWRYFAPCPECGVDAGQAHWERNLLKAAANQTGPRTDEGKRAVTRNLEGHPTPEEAQRTRFNALKTGATAQTATFFPARPGKYPECDGCEYRENVCPEQTACLKKVELFMQVHVAMDSGDPNALKRIHTNIQSSFIGLLCDVMRRAIAIGPDLSHQAYYYDKDGGLHWVEQINEETGEPIPVIVHEANPLLKILVEMLQKNGMTLDDLALTLKGQQDRQIDMGYLEAEQESSKESLDEYRRGVVDAVDALRGHFERGQAKLAKDPIYLEQQSDG